MNLHLMLDEKVISRTIDYFEKALPGQNVFIITLSKGQKATQFVKKEGNNIRIAEYGSETFWNAVGNYKEYSNIIIHMMSYSAARFINRIQHKSIIWIEWGADLYTGLLAPKGYKLFYNESEIRKLLKADKSFLKQIKDKIERQNAYRYMLKAIRKVRFICAPQGDYDLLKEYYPDLSEIERKEFFYYPLDDILPCSLLEKPSLGNDIIVGNSASLYGNHKEVFMQLSVINTEGRKIKVPLSYGASSIVRCVKKHGEEILGDNFVPILDYMPLEEYNKFLCSARTYIYGNYRQEATGNVVVALYLGGAVFLHPSNILLKEFINMGCICFSTEDLAERINYQLNDEEIRNNREIIRNYYNLQHLYSIIKKEFGTNEIA